MSRRVTAYPRVTVPAWLTRMRVLSPAEHWQTPSRSLTRRGDGWRHARTCQTGEGGRWGEKDCQDASAAYSFPPSTVWFPDTARASVAARGCPARYRSRPASLQELGRALQRRLSSGGQTDCPNHSGR